MPKEEKNYEEVELNVAERIQLLGFLNAFKDVPYETLTEVWKLIDKTKFTEQEKSEIKMEDVMGKNEQGQAITTGIKWDEKKAKTIKVHFTLDERKVITQRFEQLSKDSKLDASLYQLAQVYEKIK